MKILFRKVNDSSLFIKALKTRFHLKSEATSAASLSIDFNSYKLSKSKKYFSSRKKDKDSLDEKFANGKYNFEGLFYNNKDEYSLEYNVRNNFIKEPVKFVD